MTNLKLALKASGLSGRELAAMSGLSLSSIYKYLSGHRELTIKTARKRFERILGVPAEELVGKDGSLEF